jgi:hypothetical protein
MTGDEGFFEMFKESSESDRKFDFKQSGWDKLNSRLDANRAKKRRKYLLLLPWILLPGLLIINGILFYHQKNTNEKIAYLYKELSEKEQITTDTIVKQIHTYSHDTVYVYISGHPLSNANINKFIEEEYRVNSNSSKIVNTDNAEPDKNSNTVLQFEEKGKTASKTENPAAENINHTDSSELGKANQSDLLTDNPSLADSIYIADIIAKDIPVTSEQVVAEIDSIVKTESVVTEDSLKQNRKSFGEYLKTVTLEYGFQGGVVFPEKVTGARMTGFNVGAGMNAKLSKNFHLTSNISYGSLFVNAGRTTKSQWIQPENSPDSGYALDNSATTVKSLSLSIGLRYNIPLSNHVDLLFDVKYGAGYILPYKVVYEFKNQNPNQDLIVEKEPESFGFVPNDFLFGLGLAYKRNEKHTFYLLSHYWINRQKTLYKLPDNFGINIGLFF